MTQTEPPIIPPGEVLLPMTGGRGGRPGGAAIAKRRVTGERFKLLNAFTDAALPSLGRADMATWLVLYRDTKADGTTRTGITDIARRIGANPSTVKRAIGRLLRRGLLVRVYRGGPSRGVSRYRVTAGKVGAPTPPK